MNEETNVTMSNEGAESGYSNDVGYQEAPQEPVGATEPSPTASNGSPSTFAIRVDPRSGRREIVSVGGDDESNGVEQTQPVYQEMAQPRQQQAPQQVQWNTQQPAQPQQKEQIRMNLNIPQNLQVPQQQKLPNYANAGEVIAAMSAGTLDESRIPVEMAFQYAQFKQTLAQQQAANVQRQAEMQQPQQETAVSPDIAQARQEYFSKVESMAKENALQDIGLTEDELVTAEYSDDPVVQQKAQMYQTALTMHRNNILQAVQQERARQETEELSKRAIISNVNAHINQLAQTEPQFKAIMDSMSTLFKDKNVVDFDDGVRYLLAMNAYNQGVMTEQQATDLQEYWNLARKTHYARANNIGQPRPRSPYVEGSANSSNMQNSGTDRANLLKQLRSATDYRVKRELMGKLLGK